MEDEIRLIERTDAVMRGLEDAEIKRLNKSLDLAYKSLESELLKKWPKYSSESQPNLLPQQRSLLLLNELKTVIGVTNPGQLKEVESRFTEMLKTASAEGITLAQALSELRSDGGFVASTAKVPVEVVALAAKDAVKRLSKHSDKFKEEASVIVTQGLIQGWGGMRVAEQLRSRLGVVKGRAEVIARTEVLSAQNQASQQFYQKNGVEYIQVVATGDDRLCPVCGARNGNVYELGKIQIPFHPLCRCYGAPYRKEWAALGLTKDDAVVKAHDEGIKLLETSGRQPDNGLTPFEKAAGLTKPPEPYWSPGAQKQLGGIKGMQPANDITSSKQVSKNEGLHTEILNDGWASGGQTLQKIDKIVYGADSPKLQALRGKLLALDKQVDDLLNADEEAAFKSDAWKEYLKVSKEVAALEEVKTAKALKLMELLRQEIIESSILSRADAEKLAGNVKILKSATKGFTEEEYRAELAEFFLITDAMGAETVKKIVKTDDRAYASETDKTVNIGRNGSKEEWKATLWHELGHHVEYDYWHFINGANSWLEARADGNYRPLREITGNDAYDEGEVAFPDTFISPYVGKLYATSTEVLSMGLEHFVDAKAMLELYEGDREHFLLVLGGLRVGD